MASSFPSGEETLFHCLKKSLLVGRRESCDIVLRFSNVSAHHCQLTVNAGYWHVRDLQSRNGVKVNGVRVTDKRVDPGDILSVAKHKYEVHYSPIDLGAVGPPPPDVTEIDFFSKSLLERAGLETAEDQAAERPARAGRGDPLRHHQRRAGANPLSQSSPVDGKEEEDPCRVPQESGRSHPPDRLDAAISSAWIRGRDPAVGRAGQRQGGVDSPPHRLRRAGRGAAGARLRRAFRRGRQRLPPRAGLGRLRPNQQGRRRKRRRLSVRHPPAAEDAGDRSAARGGRRRPRALSPRRKQRSERGPDRAGRAAPRLHLPGGPRATANPRGQRRSIGHRLQRRRAAAETAPDRPLAGRRRERGRAPVNLHQQGRSGRSRRIAAAGGRLRPDGLRSASAKRRKRFRQSSGCIAHWLAGRTSSSAKAAWENPRC